MSKKKVIPKEGTVELVSFAEAFMPVKQVNHERLNGLIDEIRETRSAIQMLNLREEILEFLIALSSIVPQDGQSVNGDDE